MWTGRKVALTFAWKMEVLLGHMWPAVSLC